MRLSELQAMELLDAILGDNISQEGKAHAIGINKETVAKALQGNDDATFYDETRRKTKKAFDACMDPKKKQVSDYIASAYDWFEARNLEYSKEFLDAIIEAIGKPVDDKWADISDGKGLKRELQSNLVEMDKICSAIRECVQVETNKEHKARREREKASIGPLSEDVARRSIQSYEKSAPDNEKPADGSPLSTQGSEFDGPDGAPEPPRRKQNPEDSYWRHPENTKTPTNQVQPKHKQRAIAIAAACLAAVALVAFFAMRGMGSTGSIEIYSSEVMSYTLAGFQQEPTAGGASNAESLTVNEAFSCLNFVQNASNTPTMISSTTFVADDLDEIVEPIIKIEPIVAEDKLLVYAVNDGWGDLADSKFELFASAASDSARIPLSDCFDEEASQVGGPLAPGAVLLLGRFALDVDRYYEIANPNGNVASGWELQIYARTPDGNESCVGFLTISSDGAFLVKYGGKGGGPRYSTSLFAVLDVDDGPSRISFTSEEAAPRVEDVYRIETVIAPTRSCSVRFHEEFAVGNSVFSTDEHEVSVKVPFYETGSFANSLDGGSPMALELSKMPSASADELMQVAAKYQYSAEKLGEKILANQPSHEASDNLDVEYILRELAK